MIPLSFQTMTVTNFFLNAVANGNEDCVQTILRASSEVDKKELLRSKCETTGKDALQTAIELKNETMIDVLLPHIDQNRFWEHKAADNKTDFERAVEINPQWLFTKFLLLGEPLEVVLIRALDIHDLDNEEKFIQIWELFKNVSSNQLRYLIQRASVKGHKQLCAYLWNECNQYLNADHVYDLLESAIITKNDRLFLIILPKFLNMSQKMPLRIFPVIKRRSPELISLFLKNGGKENI